jgi:hypothetical protein
MRALPHLRTSAVAVLTILAMLIVPACGSLCAAMNHCSSGTTSSESDACHHANISAQSDSGALSSQATCGQQNPLLAVLAASDSSIQLQSTFAASALFSIGNPGNAFKIADRSGEFPSSKDSPQQSTSLENLSVLRI